VVNVDEICGHGALDGYGSPATFIIYPLVILGVSALFNTIAFFPYHMNLASIPITLDNCKNIYPIGSTTLRYVACVISIMMFGMMDLTYQSAVSGQQSEAGVPIILAGMAVAIFSGLAVAVIKLNQYRQ